MATEVTDQMVELFKLNHDPANELEQPDIRAGLAAVLHIAEQENAAELAKLRGAFEVAADSRNLWKRRAMEAGWKPTVARLAAEQTEETH